MANVSLNCPVCGVPMEQGASAHALVCPACGAAIIQKGPKNPILYEHLNYANALRLGEDFDGAVEALGELYDTNVGKSDAEVSFWLALAKYGVLLSVDATGAMVPDCKRAMDEAVTKDIVVRRVITYCADEARDDYMRILKATSKAQKALAVPSVVAVPMAEEAPVADAPAAEEVLAEEVPVYEEAQMLDAPAEEPPAEEAPIYEDAAPIYVEPYVAPDAVPYAEASAEEVPATEVPAEEIPVEEAPVYADKAFDKEQPYDKGDYVADDQTPYTQEYDPAAYPEQEGYYAPEAYTEQAYEQQQAPEMRGKLNYTRDGRELKDYDGRDAIVVLPEGIEKIGKKAFLDNDYIREVYLPMGLREIGEFAFTGCDALEVVWIPETVEIIHRYAFSSCPKIKEIAIPASVRAVGECAFARWGKSQTIVLPSANPGWRKTWDDYCYADLVTYNA